MELEQDLSVVGDVRRDAQDDSDFLELNRCAGNLIPGCARLATLCADIENANWNFLTNQNLSFAIVEGDDARLGLKVGKTNFLERVEEASELEFSECCREDELEGWIDDACIGICDCRECVPPAASSLFWC